MTTYTIDEVVSAILCEDGEFAAAFAAAAIDRRASMETAMWEQGEPVPSVASIRNGAVAEVDDLVDNFRRRVVGSIATSDLTFCPEVKYSLQSTITIHTK